MSAIVHWFCCDCAECADALVIAHELLADIDAGLIQISPSSEQPF